MKILGILLNSVFICISLILTINADHLRKRHIPSSLCNGDGLCSVVKVKSNVVPLHTMKAYGGRGMARLILNPRIRWRRVVLHSTQTPWCFQFLVYCSFFSSVLRWCQCDLLFRHVVLNPWGRLCFLLLYLVSSLFLSSGGVVKQCRCHLAVMVSQGGVFSVAYVHVVLLICV